jgi:hypothetical protein
MNSAPKERRGICCSVEQFNRERWREQGLLVTIVDVHRLTWPERELTLQLGEQLYGGHLQFKEISRA